LKNKMKVEIIKCLQDNYSYLIIDEKTNSACVIDPSEANPIINFLEREKIDLKFILNTHHHNDHVGGNEDLKKKYKCEVIGFEGDKHRIPGINICLKDREVWINNNFELKVFHIPGHTLGHICFSFFKNKLLFTGDTLFSLGCGRIFEGTHQQMFESLELLKSFPLDTKIYCGHEYTLKNSDFCILYDKKNLKLKNKIISIQEKINKGLPTVPSSLKDELETNIFLRCDSIESFSKLRDLKDNF
tara:strand:+ start:890 stop:1621 length:732 start_codon:yes stop_codon:yes gene_type:complete